MCEAKSRSATAAPSSEAAPSETATGRAGKPATVPAATPNNTPAAAAPLADAWTPSEIDDARRICRDALKSVDAIIEELPPIKNGSCGAPGPVRLVRIGKSQPVKFDPPPTISCQMLVPLNRWLNDRLQPLAAKHLGTQITTVKIMSSYNCRTRYGRAGERMSEHAFANALDIGSFRMADRQDVSVLEHWGPTQRDIARIAAQQLAARKLSATAAALLAAPVQALASKGARPRSPAPLPAGARVQPPVAEVGALPPLPVRRPLRHGAGWRAGLGGIGDRPTDAGAARSQAPNFEPAQKLGGAKPAAPSNQAIFLRGAHETGCEIFGTVLGPEANEAHRNHFHVDMHPRRKRNYCQ